MKWRYKKTALKMLHDSGMKPIPDNKVSSMHRLKLNWILDECKPLISPHALVLNTRPALIYAYVYDMKDQPDNCTEWIGVRHTEYIPDGHFISTIGMSTMVLDCSHETAAETFLHELAHTKTPPTAKSHGDTFYEHLSSLIVKYNALTGRSIKDVTKDPEYRAVQHDGYRVDGTDIYINC